MSAIGWRVEKIEACLERVQLPAIKLQTKDYKKKGKHPIIDQGHDLIAGWTDDERGLISGKLPMVLFGDHTRTFKYVDFPFVRGADGTQLLRPKTDIDPRFFFYACRELDLPSRGYNRHFSNLKEKEIALPPLDEQSEIGAVLVSVEKAIELQSVQHISGERLKLTVMRELFTHGLRGKAQQDTEIGPIPSSWRICTVGQVREWLQYGTSERCSSEPARFPVLRIPNIEVGRVNGDSLKYCNLDSGEAEKYRLQEGDLIFIRTNGVIDRLGSCAVYQGQPADALFASYLIRARLRRDVIDPKFAAYFLGSERGIGLVTGRATPAADGKYNLNTGAIDSIPIAVPPTIDEQRDIVTILDAIDKKIDLHKRKRAVLDDLFKSLLHKLMTGEIRVADLDLSALDRPAAA